MAADGGGQRQIIGGVWVARMQRLVGRLSPVHALCELITLHGPAVPFVLSAIERMYLVCFGSSEAGALRKGGTNAQQTEHGGEKKQERAEFHRAFIGDGQPKVKE